MNQIENEPIKVNVCISQTLSKNDTIYSDNYTIEDDGDVDFDDEGTAFYTHSPRYVFNNLKEDYISSNYTITFLLDKLKEYVKRDLLEINPDSPRGIYLQNIIKSCNGWVEDEFEVIEQ